MWTYASGTGIMLAIVLVFGQIGPVDWAAALAIVAGLVWELRQLRLTLERLVERLGRLRERETEVAGKEVSLIATEAKPLP